MKAIPAIVFCVLVFVACKKEAKVEPIPITYTIIASAGNGGSINPSGLVSVKAGGTQIYTITVDDNYNLVSAKVDGIDQPVTDNQFSVTNVLSNKVINVTFINKDIALLTKANSPWHLKKFEFYRVDNNQFVDSVVLITDPERLTDSYFFYLNKESGIFNGQTYEVFHKEGNVLFGNGNWTLSGKNFKIGDPIYQITLLDDKNLVYQGGQQGIRPNGIIVYPKFTYWRP